MAHQPFGSMLYLHFTKIDPCETSSEKKWFKSVLKKKKKNFKVNKIIWFDLVYFCLGFTQTKNT